MPKLVVLSIVVLAAGGSVATNTAQASSKAKLKHLKSQMRHLSSRTEHYRVVVRRNLQTELFSFDGTAPVARLIRTAKAQEAQQVLEETNLKLRKLFKQWKQEFREWRREQRTRNVGTGRPPHFQEWLCIHQHEGAWTANTGNGYYGGLQMDISFQRAYGGQLLASKGTADRWSPLEQMWVAERAHASGRGFYPWPNTARWCGLI